MSKDLPNPDDINLPGAVERLAFLTENYVPHAVWTAGGAFRFDRALSALADYLASHLKVRTISNVMGAAPCRWSLDWFVQRRPVPLQSFAARLKRYAGMNVGVHLVFDNPFIDDADLDDPYAMQLVETLLEDNARHRNAVSVASDKLRDKILSLNPQAPVACHVNRLVAEPGRRTASLYNRLLESGYARVAIHPADTAKPDLLDALQEPSRMDVVVNDPCLRNCPVRREHLRILAAMRKNAYDVRLMQQRANLIARADCQTVDPAALHQGASCNLSHNEIRALYARGMRHFLIQGQQFRNEMTLLWDILDCMLDADPEISNKAALICCASLTHLTPHRDKVSSGLSGFSFSNYE